MFDGQLFRNCAVIVLAVVFAVGCSAEGREQLGGVGEVCQADIDCRSGLVCLPCGEANCQGRCGGGDGFVDDDGDGPHDCDELCTHVVNCAEDEPGLGEACLEFCEGALTSDEIACTMSRPCEEAVDGPGVCLEEAQPAASCNEMCMFIAVCVGLEDGGGGPPNRVRRDCIRSCEQDFPNGDADPVLQEVTYCLMDYSCADISDGQGQDFGPMGICLSAARQ